MARIKTSLNYGLGLWTASRDDREMRFYRREFGTNAVEFADGALSVEADIEISLSDQVELARAVIQETPNGAYRFVPLWQHLTPHLESCLKSVDQQLHEVVQKVDSAFRRSQKGLRLPSVSQNDVPFSQAQSFPAVRWYPEGEIMETIETILSELHDTTAEKYRREGVLLPMPPVFDQKIIYIREDEVDEIFGGLTEETEIPPFWALYGQAWETFAEARNTSSAILSLATCAETGLKWHINRAGDEMVRYLIGRMPSPPLRHLFQCCREHADLDLPEHFSGWLHRLTEARNQIAHSERGAAVHPLVFGRWCATVEAILARLLDHDVDERVGKFVRPIGARREEQFTEFSRGVILRRERYQYEEEPKFHVLMDSGVSYYFDEQAFEILTQQGFNISA